MSAKKVYIYFVYIYIKLSIIKTYLLQMRQTFYNVIEDQIYCYSDLIHRAFDQVHLNHGSCVPGSTRHVCFGPRVSPILSVTDLSFQCPKSRVLGLMLNNCPGS